MCTCQLDLEIVSEFSVNREIQHNRSIYATKILLHVYLHREPHAQVRLICSWCMKICLRRAAHISAERLISANGYANEYRYGYGHRHRYGYGYRSLVCIYGLSGLEKISQSTSLRSIQSNKLLHK